MHKYSLWGVLLVCLCLPVGCAVLPPGGGQDQPQERAQAQFRIPFKRYGQHLYVWVSVNGAPQQWFILDSGAAHTIIGQDLAQSLGLRGQGRLMIQGVGTQKIPAIRTFNIALNAAGVEWQSQESWVVPPEFFTPLTEYLGYSFQGVLGAELFNRYVVEIDYQAQLLYLYDPKTYRYQGAGYKIPLQLRRQKPYVVAQVTTGEQEVESLLLVDVGSGSALSLRGALPESLVASSLSRLTLGVGGTKPIQVGRVDRLQIGEVTVEQLVANLEVKPQGTQKRIAGRIGNQVLGRFRVIFNYARQQLILEPQGDVSGSYDYDMSGLWLKTAMGDTAKTMVVARVFPGSPAAQVDLQPGDHLISIDGQGVGDLEVPQVRQLFKGPDGQARRLQVRRDQTIFEVILRLKRLI